MSTGRGEAEKEAVVSPFEPMPEALFQQVLQEVLEDEAATIEALKNKWNAASTADNEGLGGEVGAAEDGADG